MVESAAHQPLTPEQIQKLTEKGAVVIDIREPEEFAEAHIPGALNVNLDHEFTHCATALLQPSSPLVIMADDIDEVNLAATKLARLGIADVKGFGGGGIYAWQQAGMPVESVVQVLVHDLHEMIAHDHLLLSILTRNGFHKLSSIAGGMSSWIEAGYEVEESE